MDPGTKWLISKAGGAVLDRLTKAFPSNAKLIDAAWDHAVAEAALHADSAVRELVARREAADPTFVQRLATSMEEREARALFGRLVREAAQATTKERMHLLAQALAGLYTPDIDAETRSRVSRAVVALEPSDVMSLRDAASHEVRDGPQGRGHYVPSRQGSPQMDALMVAGCILDVNAAGGGLMVTALGVAVLKAVEGWAPGGGAP